MMWKIPSQPNHRMLEQAIDAHRASAYDAKVTALALAAVALLISGGACLLWGLGTSPGMMLTGMNFFPYLAGTFFVTLAIVVASSAALFTIKLGAHHYQISRLNGALQGLGEPGL